MALTSGGLCQTPNLHQRSFGLLLASHPSLSENLILHLVIGDHLLPFLSSSLDCQLYGRETPCLFYLPMFYAKAYHSAQNTQMLGKYLLNT